MKNKILNSIKSDFDFTQFINNRFKEVVDTQYFPASYEARRLPEEIRNDIHNEEIENIIERELIRDNIYSKYKFDIYEYPYVVFYQNGRSTEFFKPFKTRNEALICSGKLLDREIYSLLISIMNHNIECELFA